MSVFVTFGERSLDWQMLKPGEKKDRGTFLDVSKEKDDLKTDVDSEPVVSSLQR